MSNIVVYHTGFDLYHIKELTSEKLFKIKSHIYLKKNVVLDKLNINDILHLFDYLMENDNSCLDKKDLLRLIREKKLNIILND